ncbi:MAG: DUF4350 domain-containing protein [Bacillota bacterium]
MIDRIKKIAFYTLFIAILLVIGLAVFDIKNEEEQRADFSSYNTSKEGGKVLYLLAERMGFDISRYKRPSRFLPDKATMVAFAPDYDAFNEALEQKYLIKWIKRGNSLVLIDIESKIYDEDLDILKFSDGDPVSFGAYGENYIFKMGEGMVIFLGKYESYTNDGLKSLDPGVVFIDALNEASYKRVLFNEYYHGLGSAGANLWDILSPGGRLVLIQILLGLLIFLYVKARRFGKPSIVYEIIKRKENENLFALSNLYIKAKANGLVLEIYMDSLKNELAKFLGFGSDKWDNMELINAASANNVLKDMNVREVFGECDIYIKSGMKDTRRMSVLFEKLEKIRKEIR